MKSLSKPELTALLQVARTHSQRDHLMILVSYWHGLRASEVINLSSENLKDGFLTVPRLKGSMKTTQPLVRSQDVLFDESPLENLTGKFFPMSRMTFWRRMQEYGKLAGLPAHLCHPHVSKHTCAKLALKGGIRIDDLKQYMGHKSLASTGAYLQSDDQEASKAFAMAAGL